MRDFICLFLAAMIFLAAVIAGVKFFVPYVPDDFLALPTKSDRLDYQLPQEGN